MTCLLHRPFGRAILALGLFVLSSSGTGLTGLRQARFYAPGSNTAIYTEVLRTTPLAPGKIQLTAEIRDARQHRVATESAVINGDRLESQQYSDYLAQQQHDLVVQGETARFTTRPLVSAGEIAENEEAAGPDFVSAMTLEPFLRRHWAELLDGKSVTLDFAVLARRDTYGFQLSVLGADTFGRSEAVLLELKPTGLFTSMEIRPIQIIVDRRDQRLLKWTGRTSLQIEKQGELVPFEGEIVFR